MDPFRLEELALEDEKISQLLTALFLTTSSFLLSSMSVLDTADWPLLLDFCGALGLPLTTSSLKGSSGEFTVTPALFSQASLDPSLMLLKDP